MFYYFVFAAAAIGVVVTLLVVLCWRPVRALLQRRAHRLQESPPPRDPENPPQVPVEQVPMDNILLNGIDGVEEEVEHFHRGANSGYNLRNLPNRKSNKSK